MRRSSLVYSIIAQTQKQIKSTLKAPEYFSFRSLAEHIENHSDQKAYMCSENFTFFIQSLQQVYTANGS